MKTLSIILTILLIFPIAKFFGLATQLYIGYDSLKSFGVPLQKVNSWEMPYIILFVVYFVAFAFSVFLNIKNRCIANTIVSGLLVTAYFITLLFFGFYWL